MQTLSSVNPAVINCKKKKSEQLIDDEVHDTNPQGTVSGHEFVDLGLSVKWATCNVGANRPEDYGDYYAWGEINTKSEYTSSNSVTYGKSISDISGNPQYDVARANWGEKWRMPTKREFEELVNKCTWTWMTINGVNGYKIMASNGNHIFIPTIRACADRGRYWSSTPNKAKNWVAFELDFVRGLKSVSCQTRNCSNLIRPVK